MSHVRCLPEWRNLAHTARRCPSLLHTHTKKTDNFLLWWFWSSVALSKPVATVCPAQRRLYVVYSLDVLRCTMATWLFSLSLFFPFYFPHQVRMKRWVGKRENFTHTHTHKVCKRNKEGRERLERESMLDSQMRVCTGIQETGKLPAIHTPWGVVLLRQRLLFQDLPPLLFNRQFKTVLGRPWTADTMQIDSGTPRKNTVDLLGPNRLLASKIQSIAFFLFLKVLGGRV